MEAAEVTDGMLMRSGRLYTSSNRLAMGEGHAPPSDELDEKYDDAPGDAVLVRSNQVPRYLREPYVERGYRRESRSFATSALSLFHVHNQTVEVVSHVVALVVYAWLALLTADMLRHDPRVRRSHLHMMTLTRSDQALPADYLLFGVYYVCVWLCFASSAAYHLLGNHSRAVHDLVYRIDRAGIVAPCFGSLLLLSSYVTQCHDSARAYHLSASTRTTSLSRLAYPPPQPS